MIALGATFDDHHYASWHPTSSAGLAGAAAAAAVAMGLEQQQIASAIGHAASLAGGLWHMRHSDSMTKQVHVLHAARWGAECARLAAHGITGAPGSIEGPQGLHQATCTEPRPMELPPAWRIHEVSFKPWAACRHAHPAIDAALQLGGVEGEVLVETYADALTFCDRPDPRTPAEARFSLQHSVAAALRHGCVEPEHFEPASIADLVEVRRQVRVAESTEFTARYPAHFGARVSRASRSVECTDTLGDPERPLPQGGVESKLRSLCAWGGLGDGEADLGMELAASGSDALLDLLERWTR
jgi:2-methylcitrate dehydratase PrpD